MLQILSLKMLKRIRENSKEDVAKSSALIIKKSIDNILKKKNHIVLAVPGGRNVKLMFDELKKLDIPWNNVHLFIVDERLVPITDEESNFKIAKDNLVDYLMKKRLWSEKNIHPFIMDNNKKDYGIKDYTAELKKNGGIYDIILLSSGEDGHIGALYPNHHSIKDESNDFIIIHDSPKPPKDRMTLSRKLLEKSQVAILLFVGDTKREAYNQFWNKKTNYESCPASTLL